MEKNEQLKEAQAVNLAEDTPATPASAVKKPFIEPEISVPVNVLEATTFQSVVDSGSSN